MTAERRKTGLGTAGNAPTRPSTTPATRHRGARVRGRVPPSMKKKLCAPVPTEPFSSSAPCPAARLCSDTTIFRLMVLS